MATKNSILKSQDGKRVTLFAKNWKPKSELKRTLLSAMRMQKIPAKELKDKGTYFALGAQVFYVDVRKAKTIGVLKNYSAKITIAGMWFTKTDIKKINSKGFETENSHVVF
jgi:hypothetical protein